MENEKNPLDQTQSRSGNKVKDQAIFDAHQLASREQDLAKTNKYLPGYLKSFIDGLTKEQASELYLIIDGNPYFLELAANRLFIKHNLE